MLTSRVQHGQLSQADSEAFEDHVHDVPSAALDQAVSETEELDKIAA